MRRRCKNAPGSARGGPRTGRTGRTASAPHRARRCPPCPTPSDPLLSYVRPSFRFPAEPGRAAECRPPHRPREDGITHPLQELILLLLPDPIEVSSRASSHRLARFSAFCDFLAALRKALCSALCRPQLPPPSLSPLPLSPPSLIARVRPLPSRRSLAPAALAHGEALAAPPPPHTRTDPLQLQRALHARTGIGSTTRNTPMAVMRRLPYRIAPTRRAERHVHRPPPVQHHPSSVSCRSSIQVRSSGYPWNAWGCAPCREPRGVRM